MNSSEDAYKLAMTKIPGVGPVLARNLISYCGGIKEVFNTSLARLMKVPGIGKKTAESIYVSDLLEEAEREMHEMRKAGVRFLFFLDEDYPYRLRYCHDSPLLLFYKGSANLNNPRSIAIVGTRNCSKYGEEVTEHLVRQLASVNPLIVSGMAYGIDISAHRAALHHGLDTVGVFAHGLDTVYPGNHFGTAQKMIHKGGLLSEFPFNTNPDRENFPQRNRVVAGMVDLVIVVETAIKGGATITADIALSYDREVFAVPGPLFSPTSRGCHALINRYKAICVESAEQILNEMRWNEQEDAQNEKSRQMALFEGLESNEKKVIELLKQGPVPIDVLVERSGMDAGYLSSILLQLEFSGIVRTLPGKVYKLSGY